VYIFGDIYNNIICKSIIIHHIMWPISNLAKLGLLKFLEMTVLNIQCTGTCHLLQLHVLTFHTFYTYNDILLTFKAIYWTSSEQKSFRYCFTVSGKLQCGWVAGAGRGQGDSFKKWKRKVYVFITPSYGPFRSQTQLKLKEIYCMGNITGLHSHLQPPTGCQRQYLHPWPLVWITTVF